VTVDNVWALLVDDAAKPQDEFRVRQRRRPRAMGIAKEARQALAAAADAVDAHTLVVVTGSSAREFEGSDADVVAPPYEGTAEPLDMTFDPADRGRIKVGDHQDTHRASRTAAR
jgi:hypothetical protein